MRPAGQLIGIKPAFADDAVDAGTEAAFDIAAVNPDGARTALKAKLRLVRERPDWRLVMHGSLARYETVWRDEPLETRAIDIPPMRRSASRARSISAATASRCWRMAAWPPPPMRFRAGWVSSDNPDVPDQVDVSADRKAYAPGDTARIHIAPPFAGEATLLVLSDRVHSVRNLSVPAGGTDVDVPVSADWGTGAYVTVHVFRTAADAKSRPSRAIGLAWVGIDPGVRKLPMAFEASDKYPPRARAAIRLRTAPGAWVSLAAVDEGILRLTKFASPDPSDHFLGRRQLGLDIRDDWGRLIAPPDGAATVLRQGGDEGSFALPDIPQKTVTLFVPPVQAGADGVVEFPLDLPDFNGQVRLMAVAWSGSSARCRRQRRLRARSAGGRTAAAALPRTRRPDAADAAAAQPRPAGRRAGGDGVGGRAACRVRRGATGRHAGAGRAGAAVHHAHRDRRRARHRPAGRRGHRRLPHPARDRDHGAAGARCHDDGRRRRACAGRRDASLPRRSISSWPAPGRPRRRFGGAVRYDVAGLVQALDRYPLWCLEQATSRGFPLALLPDGPLAGPDRAARLQQAVGFVLDRQRFDGGFGLWSASAEAEPWLSVYATEFLLRARDAGAAVPEQAMIDALKFVAGAADEPGDKPDGFRLPGLSALRAGAGRQGPARARPG